MVLCLLIAMLVVLFHPTGYLIACGILLCVMKNIIFNTHRFSQTQICIPKKNGRVVEYFFFHVFKVSTFDYSPESLPPYANLEILKS